MGLIDIVFMSGIISGAVYLLYKSLWKKPSCSGRCSGCSFNSKCR